MKYLKPLSKILMNPKMQVGIDHFDVQFHKTGERITIFAVGESGSYSCHH